MRRTHASALVAAALVACAGCSGGSGGATSAPSAQGSFGLGRASGFERSGAFDPRMTCDTSQDYSPGLAFSHVPAHTAELALAMVDLDVSKIHWLVLGIPASAHGLTAHQLPQGAREALNDFGSAAYSGPCPPHGTTHRYRLTLYALRAPMPASFDGRTPPQQTLKEIQRRSVASASVVAPYKRQG